ncbi:gag protein [Tanacetum coccineum]
MMALTDPDDHLTVFMGTMNVNKLPKPAWCRFFHITLCGAARFWFQKTQAEILGIQQRPDESLKEYVARFSKETLHMADRSDIMVSRAFISGLRPGRLFKDLIAKPPTSLEDLFTQTPNFIRAKHANNENCLREPRREIKQHVTYRDLP